VIPGAAATADAFAPKTATQTSTNDASDSGGGDSAGARNKHDDASSHV
jgi:hypothetical protein